ncbi:hypothetical protein B9479_003720 [Cryptococcus floricola]|uniref:Uncharacterized protein n=1 Tax=Cryptococcus floricola TaxID=2591691 RepID=A0A5D3AZU5_9TREE|nr:hypothetical protein B9479_003720 [Cryptococcus floricola]
MERFNIPKETHYARLSVRAVDLPWMGGYAAKDRVYIADNDSYQYACTGKHFARFEVHVYAKTPMPASSASGSDKGDKKSEPKPAEVPLPAETSDMDVISAESELTCTTLKGKTTTAAGVVFGDVRVTRPGAYLGVLHINDNMTKQRFAGTQLRPDEVFTRCVPQDKNVCRVMFCPRSIRPGIKLLHPDEKSVEISYSIKDWSLASSYPTTTLNPDHSFKHRKRLRWYIRVHPSGMIEDLLTGTKSSNLFCELVPSSPTTAPAAPPKDLQAALVPAYPDVRPGNAWCLPLELFVPHLDRVLEDLGLEVECRTGMITSWLPGISRHGHIAYRILHRTQIDPTMKLTIIPPPSVLIRIFVLFKGISTAELPQWEKSGVAHAQSGLDWRDAC